MTRIDRVVSLLLGLGVGLGVGVAVDIVRSPAPPRQDNFRIEGNTALGGTQAPPQVLYPVGGKGSDGNYNALAVEADGSVHCAVATHAQFTPGAGGAGNSGIGIRGDNLEFTPGGGFVCPGNRPALEVSGDGSMRCIAIPGVQP